MSIPRTKDPRIPSYVEKLRKIRDKIDDYKAGINRTEIHEMEDGKPFKMPMFRVDSEYMAIKSAGGPPRNQLGYYPIMSWLQENSRRVHFIEGWFIYNRIYLDFSSGSLVVRFKEKGKRLFDEHKETFKFDNVTTEDELIRMENDHIVLLIGWTDRIPYILVENKMSGENYYILYQVDGVSDADAIIDPEKPTRRADEPDDDDDSDDDGDIVPIKKERERTIRMREDTKPDRVNENEVIDLTITRRVPGVVDLTGDMDEEQPTRPVNPSVSPVRSVRPNNPIRPVNPEPVMNNTMYEGESDYASEEPEDNGIDFYGRDDEPRYNRSPVKSPVLSRETSPFSNRSPFSRLRNDNLPEMSPVRESTQQYFASPGRMHHGGNESNFDISLLDTEDNESQIGHDEPLSSQSTALVSQLNHQFSQTEQPTEQQTNQPEPTNQINQPEQTYQTNQLDYWMSEDDNTDIDTMF